MMRDRLPSVARAAVNVNRFPPPYMPLRIHPNFIDKDETLATGTKMPCWNGTELSCCYSYITHASGFYADREIFGLYFVVLYINGICYITNRCECVAVCRNSKFHIARHPYPRPHILAKACTYFGNFARCKQIYYGYEIFVLIPLPATRAPLHGATPAIPRRHVTPDSAPPTIIRIEVTFKNFCPLLMCCSFLSPQCPCFVLFLFTPPAVPIPRRHP